MSTSVSAVRRSWRDVHAWCAGDPCSPAVCDWEIETTESSQPSPDDVERAAAQHIQDTGHQVNVVVHDFYVSESVIP